MAITLPPEAQQQALTSLKRYCSAELDAEPSDIELAQLLAFMLKEIGPSIYNAGVTDAQAFVRDRLADLEATCYEPEFAYWPKGSSVPRKR